MRSGRHFWRTANPQVRSASRTLAQKIEQDSVAIQDDVAQQIFVHENHPTRNCRIVIEEETIAQGTQGAVYKATVYCKDLNGLEKQLPCAAKALKKSDVVPAEFINHQRLTRVTTSSRESGVISSLGVHCNADGNYFNIMLEGAKDLKTYLPVIRNLAVKNSALFQHVLMDIIESIGKALDVSTRFKFVHGDFKLENILFCNGWRVCDLGVVESYADFALSTEVKGSPYYTAPELYASDRTCPSAIDIYSVGVILRQLLDMPKLFDIRTSTFLFVAAKKTAYDNAKVATSVVTSQQDLRTRISTYKDVISCVTCIVDAMCCPLPVNRPDLETLKVAFAHLQRLLQTVPIKKNAVSDFYIDMLHPSYNTNDSDEEEFRGAGGDGRSPVVANDGRSPVSNNQTPKVANNLTSFFPPPSNNDPAFAQTQLDFLNAEYELNKNRNDVAPRSTP